MLPMQQTQMNKNEQKWLENHIEEQWDQMACLFSMFDHLVKQWKFAQYHKKLLNFSSDTK